MKKTVALLMLTLSFGFVWAGDNNQGATKPQTVCPIMGGKIDRSIYADVQGQRVYFCCSACIDTFKKDVDTYFKKAAADGIVFENVQTACPVSGQPVDSEAFIDYQGRRVLFCCNGCKAKFNENPQKYLDKLDQKTK